MIPCPRKNPLVLDELLADGGMVLFHRRSRQIVTLNASAAFVWECCDGTRTISAIAAEMRELFPRVPTVANDVTVVLDHLNGHGMLLAGE